MPLESFKMDFLNLNFFKHFFRNWVINHDMHVVVSSLCSKQSSLSAKEEKKIHNNFRIHVRHVNKSSYLWAHKSAFYVKFSWKLSGYSATITILFNVFSSALFFVLWFSEKKTGGYKKSLFWLCQTTKEKNCENSKKDLHTCQTRAFFMLNCFVVCIHMLTIFSRSFATAGHEEFFFMYLLVFFTCL